MKEADSFPKFNSSKNLSISSCDIERKFSKLSLIKNILTYEKDKYLSPSQKQKKVPIRNQKIDLYMLIWNNIYLLSEISKMQNNMYSVIPFM